jgi:rubrerythrin
MQSKQENEIFCSDSASKDCKKEEFPIMLLKKFITKKNSENSTAEEKEITYPLMIYDEENISKRDFFDSEFKENALGNFLENTYREETKAKEQILQIKGKEEILFKNTVFKFHFITNKNEYNTSISDNNENFDKKILININNKNIKNYEKNKNLKSNNAYNFSLNQAKQEKFEMENEKDEQESKTNLISYEKDINKQSENSSFFYKEKPSKRRYTKSKDVLASQQRYSCKICGKIYISYPAFYTHKRNRHNIIPITNRHDLLKGLTVKYNYNSIGYGKTVNFEFSEFLISLMKKIIEKIYFSENSLFYKADGFTTENHIFIQYLEKYKLVFAEKILIPSVQSNLSIDEILIVYFILFAKVSNEDKLIEHAAIFLIYFREYLNLHGFNYYSYFIKFRLIEINIDNFSNNANFDYNNSDNQNSLKNQKPIFTQNPFIQYIPDLAEDFIFSFMKISDMTALFGDLENMEALCKNLCNWIFINELSNLKLIVHEKKKLGYFIGEKK